MIEIGQNLSELLQFAVAGLTIACVAFVMTR
jgi:hypothetical protein